MAAFLQIALLFFFVFFVFTFLRGLIEGFSGKPLEWDFLGSDDDDAILNPSNPRYHLYNDPNEY